MTGEFTLRQLEDSYILVGPHTFKLKIVAHIQDGEQAVQLAHLCTLLDTYWDITCTQHSSQQSTSKGTPT